MELTVSSNDGQQLAAAGTSGDEVHHMVTGTDCKVVADEKLIKQSKITGDNLHQPEDLRNCDLYVAEEGFSKIDIDKRQPQGADEHEQTTDMAAPALAPLKDQSDQVIAVTRSKTLKDQVITQPHEQLPKPEAPPGLFKPILLKKNDDASTNRSQSLKESLAVDVPAIGKFIRDRSNSWSSAIAKRLSSFKEKDAGYMLAEDLKRDVTQINLNELQVMVKRKSDEQQDQKELKGRISFFSRSNCRDCTAVRSFFRERGLKFVEINIDVYPLREKELVEKTGSAHVPQIFFNEKLFGGLVALNSLRNSSDFEERVEEMLRKKCPGEAPAQPVYGFDDPEEESMDEMLGIVRVLRQRLPIQDRLMKMKIVKNCFSGSEMVEVLIHHFDCGRKKAVEIGRQIAKRHFIHHVFGENDFEDGNNFYRFLEHEPFIPRCFNYRGFTNDGEPKSASELGLRMTKIMGAILESYASDDGKHLDYAAISKSEEFRRYGNLSQQLHRVDMTLVPKDERLTFFLNLYNAMVIHAVIRISLPSGSGTIDRRSFYSDFQYVVGGYSYSLTTIKNGILRNNRRAPYSLVKPLGTGDKRLELALPKVNLLVNFGLCDGTRSSPPVRFFSVQGVETELRCAAREFFQSGAVEVDLERRTVRLTRIIKWFSVDFGEEMDILRWIMNYLDATQAGLLMHLLGDSGPVHVVYQDYDWSVNS